MISKWDLRFLKLAEQISLWSKDPSTKCGSVLTTLDNRLVSVGFNGFPRGIADTPQRLNDRDTKYALTVHAERNAIVLAGRPVEGTHYYGWPFGPCTPCAVLLIQAGVKRVVVPSCPADKYERWGVDLGRAVSLLIEAGVETWIINGEELA